MSFSVGRGTNLPDYSPVSIGDAGPGLERRVRGRARQQPRSRHNENPAEVSCFQHGRAIRRHARASSAVFVKPVAIHGLRLVLVHRLFLQLHAVRLVHHIAVRLLIRNDAFILDAFSGRR